MADIELVIKISENDLQSIGKKVFTVGEMFETTQGRVYYAIAKGTQLPKEHEPCEDCISRKEMLKYQEYLHGKMSNEENHKLWEFIKGLPSVTPQEPNTWSLDDAREDFMSDVYNTLDFLPTNDEANQIIDSFDSVASGIRQESILDKIKAEIDEARFVDKDTKLCRNANASGLEVAMQIIDKYKAESEGKE